MLFYILIPGFLAVICLFKGKKTPTQFRKMLMLKNKLTSSLTLLYEVYPAVWGPHWDERRLKFVEFIGRLIPQKLRREQRV